MKIIFGKDQQPGSRTSLISDGVFHAGLSLRGRKDSLPFSMVVDMNREPHPPVSAAELFENSVEFLKARSGQDARSMLLELAGKIIQFSQSHGIASLLSFSIALVEGQQLHTFSFGGRTRLYLVQRGKTEQLSTNVASQQGGASGPVAAGEIESGYSAKILATGDKVILCTDGLYSMLQDVEELGVIERYDNPTFSAKHLTSIAMGRNVDQNASAGIINYGKRVTLRNSPALIGGGIALIALIAVGLALLLREPQVVRLPEDLGLAVHVSGQLYQVNPGDSSTSLLSDYAIINPGTHLAVNSSAPVHLKLKTRVLETNSTRNIDGVDLFLADGSVVFLSSLDYARMIDDEPAPAELLDQSTIELLQGSLLMRNEAPNRQYHVLLRGADGENEVVFTLAQRGVDSGMIGAKRDGDLVEVYCLAGSCNLSVVKEVVPIPEGSKTVLDLRDMNVESMTTNQISPEESAFWGAIAVD